MMKSFFKIATLFLLVAMVAISCNKDYPQGPRGEEGPQGPQGEQGIQGVGIQSIITDPNDDSKAVVTFTDGSTQTITLPDGAKGENGVSITSISNSAVPNQAIVTFSDGTTTNIDLPKGDKGDKGEPGEDGVGITQILIQDPVNNPQDATIYFSDGSTAPLTLPTGPQGLPGVGIQQIFQPDDTSIVFVLTDGSGYLLSLPRGPAGTPGKDGNTILSGSSAPTNADGKIGDFFLDLSTMDLYGPKASSGWGSATSLIGPPGDSADVIYSDWITLNTTTDWTTLPSGELGHTFNAPRLTADILNKGTIKVYFRGVGEATVHQTPTIDPTLPLLVNSNYEIGTIQVTLLVSGSMPASWSSGVQFRWIIIPGVTPARRSHPFPDWDNYQAVCEYFGIPK